MTMEIFGLEGIGEVRPGDDLGVLLLEALNRRGRVLRDNDVLIVSSKIVSKAEGRIVDAENRDAAIAAASVRRVAARRTPRGLAQIVESKAGPVMAAAGVDASNVEPGTVLLLPVNPDASARALRARLAELTGARIGVILSDTAGRAWRAGQVDFALGAAGLLITDDLRGAVDTYGQPLEVTMRALVDELASAADLVKGKLTGIPAAVIRGSGVPVTEVDGPGAASLLRPAREDWFRYGHVEAVGASLGLDPATLEPPTVPRGPIQERFIRAFTVAMESSPPWDSATADMAEMMSKIAYLMDEDDEQTIIVTQYGSGNGFEAAGILASLAQRLAAAAWAEELIVNILLLPTPDPQMRVTATDA